jgi:2-octaprenyl-6-methoxyphenol hydroxylase
MADARHDYDIVIVGGGLVGASLGVALAAGGLSAALLEAVPYGRPDQPSFDDRSVALGLGSKRIFEALGVWRRIPAVDAAPILNIHISDRGLFGFARLDRRDLGVEALGYVVANRALGAALAAVLAESSALTLIAPATLTALDVAADGVSVGIDRNGRRETLTARLVVAADGGDSTVRALAGIEARRTGYRQSALVANVGLARDHAGTAYERFTSSGPLAMLPMADRRCAVVWTLAPEAAEAAAALPDDAFLLKLQAAFGGRLGAFLRVGRRQVYPLALTRVRELTRPRLALIGNAAHTVHPVAGQGFNLGLRDVALLAELLSAAHTAGRDPGDAALLADYAAQRRRDNLVVSGFTDGLVRVFSNDFLPLAVARNLGLIAVDLLPPLKRGLMRRTMGLAGRLPRLARGLPLR